MGLGDDVTLHQDDGRARDTVWKCITAIHKHSKTPIVLLEMSPKSPKMAPLVTTGYVSSQQQGLPPHTVIGQW